MNHKEGLRAGTLVASFLSQSVFYGMQYPQNCNARSFCIAGLLTAAGYSILIFLFGCLPMSYNKILRWSLHLYAAVAAGITVCQALALPGQTFSGSAGWLLLFFVVMLLQRPSAKALNSTGWVLRWFAAGAVILLVVGVYDQLEWRRFSFALPLPLWLPLCFYPEYLAAAMMQSALQQKRFCLLPFADCAVRSLFVLLTELVFGTALADQLAHGELLRVWGLGIFSRFDSFLLLVWLMLALLRVMVLAYLARDGIKERSVT